MPDAVAAASGLPSLLGYASVVVTVVTSIYGLWRIWKGTHKPHAFSVLIWVIICAIACINMLHQGAGVAAYRTGILVVLLVINFTLCCRQGLGYITRSDWVFLAAALGAVPLWITSGDPDTALIWLLLVETAGNVPTFRKVWQMPYDLSPLIFFFVAVGQALQCASLMLSPQHYSAVLLFYLAYFPLQFFTLAFLLVYRRRQLPHEPAQTYPQNLQP